MWYKWFFDGIGSSVFSLVVGAIIGSFTGYKIGINKKIKYVARFVERSSMKVAIVCYQDLCNFVLLRSFKTLWNKS